jgi:DNA-binding transcriptional LysR family regulator
VTVPDLNDTPWLINGSQTRCEAATRLILDHAGISPPITGAVADNRTLLALVAAGHGVTIVPELMLARTPPDLTVAAVDLGVTRTILAVTRTSAGDGHHDLINDLVCALTPDRADP